ncbi:MAG: AAA family ATPase, partial [Bacteroidota bacterium]
MIPIRLTLKGINSYQEPYEVDFTRLVEGQLFGIFGPVGSGKSTILEAIALALYGETERLNVKDDRNYNLMNLRSDELFVDFVFETGISGDQYRFTIQGKRNRKRFEKVNTFSRAAYHWSEGEWQPIAPDSAEGLIGLNYKNFRRTVIIPQGKFQEFLRLKAADRTRMLKEIFSLERFDLGAKVKSLSFKNKQNMERLEGSLAEYATILPESLEAKKEILVELQKELSLLEAAVERSLYQKNIFEEFFQVHERYNKARQQLEKTKTQLEKIELIV